MNVDQIIKRHEGLKKYKMNWEEHWDDVLNYVVPRKADVWTPKDQNSGEKREQRVVDGTAIDACDKLSSALHAMLTNPATKWFSLSTGIEELDRNDEVRLWLQKCENAMYSAYESSNFYTELHEFYIDLASIGTATMVILEDDESDLAFHSRPIYEMEVDENSRGIIDVVIRSLRWTSRQIMQEFPAEKIPQEVKDDYEKNGSGSKRWEILHAVYPAKDDEYMGAKLAITGKKFVSKYILKDTRTELSVGGFSTSPYLVSRWSKISGEIFGRGPGMKALPDIKMINAVMKTTIRAAQKVTDPPMLVPDDGFYFPPNITPGGVNYYRPGSKDRIETMDIKSRPDFGIQFLDRLELKIKEAFYINQLMLTREPQMTATEVMQRTEESLRMMGPILGRQHFEFLKPLTDRVFEILVKRKKIPAAPDVLRDAGITAKYSSMIAKAQKTAQADLFSRALGTILPIAQVAPEVMDKFNGDEAFEYLFELYGLPQEVKRNQDEVDNIRAQKQQQMEQAMAQQQNTADADVLAKVAPAAIQSKALEKQ